MSHISAMWKNTKNDTKEYGRSVISAKIFFFKLSAACIKAFTYQVFK